MQEVRSQLEAEKTRGEEIWEELSDTEQALAEVRSENSELQAQISELKQKSAAASELPEAADLLNQLKAKRKKSTTTLADVETILEFLEGT